MTITSRIIENPESGSALENASAAVDPAVSGTSKAVSSMLETVTRGGLFVPVLLLGPTVSDITETTARISWELDPSEPIGYHRVRHRPTAGGDWTVTAWSDTASYSAVVDLSGLDAGTEHDYQVQSCHYGDGTLAFDYAPDPADTFTTESAGDIVFSAYELSKNPILNKVIVDWTTDVATKDKIRSRLKDSGDDWDITTLGFNFKTDHSVGTQMECTPNVYWEFQAYGITEGGYEEWDVLKFVRIDAQGNPQMVN